MDNELTPEGHDNADQNVQGEEIHNEDLDQAPGFAIALASTSKLPNAAVPLPPKSDRHGSRSMMAVTNLRKPKSRHVSGSGLTP